MSGQKCATVSSIRQTRPTRIVSQRSKQKARKSLCLIRNPNLSNSQKGVDMAEFEFTLPIKNDSTLANQKTGKTIEKPLKELRYKFLLENDETEIEPLIFHVGPKVCYCFINTAN